METDLLTNDFMFQLAESSPDSIVVCDERGKIIFLNSQTVTFFGYGSKEDLLGQQISVLVPENLRQIHETYHKGYMKAPIARPMGSKIMLSAAHKDGHLLPVEISLSPIEIKNRTIVICWIRDQSELKSSEFHLQQLNEKLLSSNKSLEEYAYLASHDLQEPIRTISKYCQLIQDSHGTVFDQDAYEYFEIILQSCSHMRDLIQDLLVYSKINKDQRPHKIIELNDVVDQALLLLRGQIELTEADITCGKLPKVKGDFRQFTQLIQNIIGNAIKFSGRHKPVISLSSYTEEMTWIIAISDRGIGIEEKYREKVFELFQRLHRKDQYEGTGIGLAICKKVVEQHGGKIWFESEVGKGTTFYISIPKDNSE